jgi:hypothetical protein
MEGALLASLEIDLGEAQTVATLSSALERCLRR